MSALVDDRLPDPVRAALSGEDLERKVGTAYVLMTTDPDGAPRPCMLSAGEILVTGPRSYRLGLWPGTRTGANLGEGRVAVLCYVDVGTVLYIRGRPRPLSGREGVERFEVAVDSVASDAHPGLPVTSPITYACAGMTEDDLLAMWRGQLASLREDA